MVKTFLGAAKGEVLEVVFVEVAGDVFVATAGDDAVEEIVVGTVASFSFFSSSLDVTSFTSIAVGEGRVVGLEEEEEEVEEEVEAEEGVVVST